MKRKKWSELEEQTLLSKYSDLHTTGTLAKLKTREKKFKPIAEHLNSVHHLIDPITFPFKWSWRDVSIKVQNMRHQYLGVKQKIRVSDTTDEYNWNDGENHWENFMKYKEVFGDIELDHHHHHHHKRGDEIFRDSGYGGGDEFFGFGFEELDNDNEDEDEEEDDDDNIDDESDDDDDECGSVRVRKSRKGKMLGLVGAQMVELRDVVMRREEKRREREWRREEGVLEREEKKNKKNKKLEIEIEDKEMVWAKRLEMEVAEERSRRMAVEEKWEEEEMNWREKMVRMQMEHEKQMMQLHANACQNQMQILGVMARLLCQFLGSASDGLGSLGTQVLQQHQGGGLDENGKPDANSPSEFL